MNWTSEDIETTLRAVTERSMTDSKFRALALSDPLAAISQVATKPVAKDFKIQFVDNAGADMTVVLPDAAKQGAPVSEEELAGVAGGVGGPTLNCATLYCATIQCTHSEMTACNPGYTKKPGSPAFCPK